MECVFEHNSPGGWEPYNESEAAAIAEALAVDSNGILRLRGAFWWPTALGFGFVFCLHSFSSLL
jgi:hypothetical protein